MTIICQERRIAVGGALNGSGYGSSGTITTVAAADLAPGDKFHLRSLRTSEIVTFTFFDPTLENPDTSDLVRYIPIIAGHGTADVANLIVAEINRVRALALFANRSGAAQVTLEHALDGLKTNYSHPDDEVVNAGFVVSAMTGATVEPRSYRSDGCVYYDAAAAGGRFVFSEVSPSPIQERDGSQQIIRILGGVLSWRIDAIVLSIPSATDYTIRARGPDGQLRTLATDTGSVDYVVIVNSTATPMLLFWDERLEIVASGVVPANGWWVRVLGKPLDPVPATSLAG